MGFQVLVNQMRSVINNLQPGTEFMLRDIIAFPPAVLGRILYRAVESGDIENVICIEKGKGQDKYRKL